MKRILVCVLCLIACQSYAQRADSLSVRDTRPTNALPAAYKSIAKFEFKERANIGVPGLDLYTGLMTIAPWVDNTGGKNHQLAFNNGGIYYRMGQPEGSWEGWQKVLIEDNGGSTMAHTFHVSAGVDANMERPEVGAGSIAGEIRGVGQGWIGGDNGFLRISAGGGNWYGTKSFIDLSGYMPSTSDRFQNITFGTSGVERCRLDAYGNFSIGTKDAKGYKLAVNGPAIFTKAVVKASANWPDYVFDSAYQLPTLESISNFIQENKHLPDMPAGSTVEKSGHDLGEMQMLLLKKVEELTLYVIEQEKQMKDLKDENKKIIQQNEVLIQQLNHK